MRLFISRQLGAVLAIAAFGWTIPALAAEAPAAGGEQVLEPIVVGTPERIEVYPPSIKLESVRARMQLVVSGFYPGGGVQDLTRAAEFFSANEQLAKVAAGVATPVANGASELIVRVAGQDVKVPVEV